MTIQTRFQVSFDRRLHKKLKKTGLGVLEKSINDVDAETDGRTDDRRQVITNAHPDIGSGKLKKEKRKSIFMFNLILGMLRKIFTRRHFEIVFLFSQDVSV